MSHTPPAARHTLPALPATCVHVADDPEHTSRLHGSPSPEQGVSAGASASTGQDLEAPSHLSATSHSPALLRQVTAEVATESAGQLALPPVQFSATSQTPTLPRHTVAAETKLSAGQLVEPPVHVSWASQTPAEARHTEPALPAGCVQDAEEPLQTSSVHGSASAEHTVSAG